MATLIYSPQISCHVETAKGILDISDDLVSWQLMLRENAPHTFTFELQNNLRKYDGLILPMDRITVGLKRINWLHNFTGYINSGPIFQAWPGVLNISASCTLKRLQYLYWDPTTIQAQQLMLDAMKKFPSGSQSKVGAAGSTLGDKGLSSMISTMLSKVANWPIPKIHIGEVPNTWATLIDPIIKDENKDLAVYEQIGLGYVISGTASNVAVDIPAGKYGPETLSTVQVKNAGLIYAACKAVSSSDAVATMALMCARDESTLHNLWSPNVPGSQQYSTEGSGTDPGSPGNTSCGLFQQQDGWGSVAQRMDPTSATNLFLNSARGQGGDGLMTVLKKHNIKNPDSIAESQYGYWVQVVQVSSGGEYQKFLDVAKSLVKSAGKLATAAPGSDPTTGSPSITTTPGNTGKTPGASLASTAVALINAHQKPNPPILWVDNNWDRYDTPMATVQRLDCSSLVDWVYYNATGKKLGTGKPTAAEIYALCSHIIPLPLARHVQGAVMFIGGAGAHHVGMSIGNNYEVADHQPYPDHYKEATYDPIDSGGGFDSAGLLPGIDYAASGTTQAAADQLAKIIKSPTRVGPQVDIKGATAPSGTGGTASSDTNAAFEALINSISFNADINQVGESLVGPVAMINDQPFLPWLQTLINSSLRSFCSAPNGDFIAWFPDYFGNFSQMGAINIEPIELQDFQVTWSDQQIVTHQFVLGNSGVTSLDQDTGSLDYTSEVATDLVSLALGSSGVATMDYPEIFEAIYGAKADSRWVNSFLQRFGARPNMIQMPQIARGRNEFYMAIYQFMKNWAGQFTATIPLTFMPEVFPGMLLKIPDYGFQCYVQGVTHTGSYGPGGAFTTTVEVCAPAVIGDKNKGNMLSLLPEGGRGVLDNAPASDQQTARTPNKPKIPQTKTKQPRKAASTPGPTGGRRII
jgi:cell wall-associated NlpC family hydrolase